MLRACFVSQFDCGGMIHEEVPSKLTEALLLFLQGLGHGEWSCDVTTKSRHVIHTVINFTFQSSPWSSRLWVAMARHQCVTRVTICSKLSDITKQPRATAIRRWWRGSSPRNSTSKCERVGLRVCRSSTKRPEDTVGFSTSSHALCYTKDCVHEMDRTCHVLLEVRAF